MSFLEITFEYLFLGLILSFILKLSYKENTLLWEKKKKEVNELNSQKGALITNSKLFSQDINEFEI